MKAKYLFLTLAAALFTLSSCRDEPKPEVKDPVMKCSIRLIAGAEAPPLVVSSVAGEGEIWIDLNGDGSMQPNEKLVLYDYIPKNNRDFTTSTATIHGKILMLNIESNSCVSIDATGNPHLQTLWIDDHDPYLLESVDLSKNNQLVRCGITGKNLTTIKLSPQAIDLKYLFLECPRLDDKQLLEIAKTLPDRTSKKEGYWRFRPQQPSQEVLDLLKKKNWEYSRY